MDTLGTKGCLIKPGDIESQIFLDRMESLSERSFGCLCQRRMGYFWMEILIILFERYALLLRLHHQYWKIRIQKKLQKRLMILSCHLRTTFHWFHMLKKMWNDPNRVISQNSEIIHQNHTIFLLCPIRNNLWKIMEKIFRKKMLIFS